MLGKEKQTDLHLQESLCQWHGEALKRMKKARESIMNELMCLLAVIEQRNANRGLEGKQSAIKAIHCLLVFSCYHSPNIRLAFVCVDFQIVSFSRSSMLQSK